MVEIILDSVEILLSDSQQFNFVFEYKGNLYGIVTWIANEAFEEIDVCEEMVSSIEMQLKNAIDVIDKGCSLPNYPLW